MIYRILKLLFTATVRVYFKRYSAQQADRIPKKGPLVFVANHPSTFMDPIVIAVLTKRKIHFIAKGEVFRSRFAQWILPKFNMIPVYRKEHDPEKAHLNDEVFNKVYELLEQGGAILIFPEGISLEGRALQKIKSGAARMALGAEARNDFQLGVKIIPIGLNYSNPYKFQETLLAKIDQPIELSAYKSNFEKDALKTTHQLSDEIRIRLENLFVKIQDEKINALVNKIETVYQSKIFRELGYSTKVPEQVFETTRLIRDRVEYHAENDSERVAQFESDIDTYLRMLEKLKLNDKTVSNSRRRTSFFGNFIVALIYFIVGFPLYVFGVMTNYIPFMIPYYIVKAFKLKTEFVGAISMVCGMFSFLIFYSLQILLFSLYYSSDFISILLFCCLLPISGWFAYTYAKRFTQIKQRWHFMSLFWRQGNLVTQLLLLRKKIIDAIELGRKDFDNANS